MIYEAETFENLLRNAIKANFACIDSPNHAGFVCDEELEDHIEAANALWMDMLMTSYPGESREFVMDQMGINKDEFERIYKVSNKLGKTKRFTIKARLATKHIEYFKDLYL